jgi:hypothetical protein
MLKIAGNSLLTAQVVLAFCKRQMAAQMMLCFGKRVVCSDQHYTEHL